MNSGGFEPDLVSYELTHHVLCMVVIGAKVIRKYGSGCDRNNLLMMAAAAKAAALEILEINIRKNFALVDLNQGSSGIEASLSRAAVLH
jgi:hypothetical protein